jgi:hypothetical protein
MLFGEVCPESQENFDPARNTGGLVDLGGYTGVREKGLLKLEGKEYIVKDGDVLVIRHG